MSQRAGASVARVVGRYALYDEIGAGGMATVHLGRLIGPVGFSRTVAIKQLHPQFAKDPEFVAMFLDEARLAARIGHPNVAATLDVVAPKGELLVVMEYIPGESLARLMRETAKRDEYIPLGVVVALMHGVLQGLDAAHDATSETGEPLGIVHRDVSPTNILVGSDGVPRLLDFGVAKAIGRLQTTQEGQLKGKLPYMAPEQLRGEPVDRRADVYAAGVVLWEALAGERLFTAESRGGIMARIVDMPIEPPSARSRRGDPAARRLDDVALRALARDPDHRFATAREMALALESVWTIPTAREVGDYVRSLVGDSLDGRAARVREIESSGVVAEAADERADAMDAGGDASSVSIVTSPRAAALRSRTRWAIAATVCTAALSAALGYRLSSRAAVSSAPAPDTRSPQAAPAAVGDVAATPEPSAVALEPKAQPQSAEAPPSDVGARAAAPRSRAPTPTKPRGRLPTKASSSCNPPYTVDADGVHIPKPECG